MRSKERLESRFRVRPDRSEAPIATAGGSICGCSQLLNDLIFKATAFTSWLPNEPLL